MMINLLNKAVYSTAKMLRKIGLKFNEDKDSRVLEMKTTIKNIGGKIEFKIEQFPDGSWVAESTNVDGIVTGGTSGKNISLEIKDAIFTYFSIPPQLCNDEILRLPSETITTRQAIYV